MERYKKRERRRISVNFDLEVTKALTERLQETGALPTLFVPISRRVDISSGGDNALDFRNERSCNGKRSGSPR